MHTKRWFVSIALAALFIVAGALGPGASADVRTQADRQDQSAARQSQSDPGHPAAGLGNDDFFGGHQHGGIEGHLPPIQENVDLVSKLKLTNNEDDVSDVSALQAPNGKWYAYVGDWGAKCASGGVNVVDISDPSNPQKVRFLNSSGSGYVTEGLHALRIDTDEYTGDILVISNEWCRTMPSAKQMPGGITIWDINNPESPKLLVEAFGDFDLLQFPDGTWHLMVSDWDAGWIDVDVTDAHHPVIVGDHYSEPCDPLIP